MPTLILTSVRSTSSILLRKTAQKLEWDTIRIDGEHLPDWFELKDKQLAIYHPGLPAFKIAKQLSFSLLGIPPKWLSTIPFQYLNRNVQVMTLAQAYQLKEHFFIKPALNKAFPHGIYSGKSLLDITQNLIPQFLVHVIEPVKFILEYRFFVLNRKVMTFAAYLRFGKILEDIFDDLNPPQEELIQAKTFCELILNDKDIRLPAALVLDVGLIEGRGWAIIEANECWASGLYCHKPISVLQTLLGACIPNSSLTPVLEQWDSYHHYLEAIP